MSPTAWRPSPRASARASSISSGPLEWKEARPAADDAAIVALCAALYREDPATSRVDARSMRRTLARLRREPARGLAVVLRERGRQGAVAGYALLVSFWSNELGGEVCTIDEMYVAASARSRGHGAALIASVVAGRRPWGRLPVAVELEVSPRNRRARALYVRLGFQPRRNATLRLRR